MLEVEILKLPPFLDVEGVFRYFSINPRKTRQLLAEGKIKGSKSDKLWIIESASVVKYLKKNIITPAPLEYKI